jgi:hypothetical protein
MQKMRMLTDRDGHEREKTMEHALVKQNIHFTQTQAATQTRNS